jgi:hypothetical protein
MTDRGRATEASARAPMEAGQGVDRGSNRLSPGGRVRRPARHLLTLAFLGASLAGCRNTHSPPDPALAKVGPALCSGVTGDYKNIAYAFQFFFYSDGETTFPSVMGYLSMRGNLPETNGGLNKFVLVSPLDIHSPYYEIWVDETIPTALQDVLAGTPDPVGVFARNVTYEWEALDGPKQTVRLSVKRMSDLSFCHNDALLNP